MATSFKRTFEYLNALRSRMSRGAFVTTVEILRLPEPGLGNQSYLVGSGDGGSVVIDPARDPAHYVDATAAGFTLEDAR